ncbi:hypothetical protein [Endozoicomonas sp. 4G]|uniref:hypothetical protein n=1 Tax=Endozoicomonas sp. 4G TaxID=2872754 RepID=UPI002078B125|nr:hypothetical protein [Endozoicomonas sp. 4G]
MLIQKLRYSNYTPLFMLFILSLASPSAFSSPYLGSNSWLNSLATMFVLHSAINPPGHHNAGLADASSVGSCRGSCQFEPQLHEYFKGSSVVLFVRAVQSPCAHRIFDEFDDQKEIWFGDWDHELNFIGLFMMKIQMNGTLSTIKDYSGRFSYSYKVENQGANLQIVFKDVQQEEAGFYGVRFRYDSWPSVMFTCKVELRHIFHGPVRPNIAVLKGNEARFQYRFNPTVDNEIPSLDSVRFGPQQKNGSIETYLYWQKDEGESGLHENAEKHLPVSLSNPRTISLDLSDLGNYTFAVILHGVNVNDTGRYLCDIEVTRSLKTLHTLTTNLIVNASLTEPEMIESSSQSPAPKTHALHSDGTTSDRTTSGETTSRKKALTIKLSLPTATHAPITGQQSQQGCLYPDPAQKTSSRTYGEGIGAGIAIGIPTGAVIVAIAARLLIFARHYQNNQNDHLIGNDYTSGNGDILLQMK